MVGRGGGGRRTIFIPIISGGRLYPLVTITTEGECGGKGGSGERECLEGIRCLDLADDNGNMSASNTV